MAEGGYLTTPDGGCLSTPEKPASAEPNIPSSSEDPLLDVTDSIAELIINPQALEDPNAEPPLTLAVEMMRGDDIYQMKRGPRGFCLIINNIHFEGRPDLYRRGSADEALAWESLFVSLGFSVSIHHDLSAEKMEDVYETYSQSAELKNHDSFVSVVLTHGHKEVLFGSDMSFVRIERVLEFFNNQNCRHLIHKPKLFFLQACRGDKRDFGVVPPESEADVTSLYPMQVSNNLPPVIPTWSDIAVCYGTVDGYVALRNTDTGSWFGDALRRVILTHSHNTEFHMLLVKANQKMMTRSSRDGYKQSLEVNFRGWCKAFFFNPGIFEL